MAAGGVVSRARALVERMRTHAESADEQASGCREIARLVLQSATGIGSVAGVFEVIVGAMRRHEGVAEVQEFGCLALGSLAAFDAANRRAIGSVEGVFEAIVGAMRRHEGVAKLQEFECFALASLAINDAANRRAIGSVAGVFEAVVGAMRRHEGVAEVQRRGCLALGNLASHDAANTRAIGSVAGVFEAVVGAMRRHEGVAKLQEFGCFALASLAANDKLNADRLAAVPGATEVLRSCSDPQARQLLEAVRRASTSAKRADEAERTAVREKRRADEEAKRADEEAKRADEEAKRADEEATRADAAERRAATEKERADRAEAPPGPTPATARIALVIANAEYQGDEPPLPRCADDGEAMEATLRARGFDVTRHNDLDSRQLARAVADFSYDVSEHPGCIAVLYFTGHGYEEDNGELCLVPVNGAAGLGGRPRKLRQIEHLLLDDTAGQESTIIIILDCCRINDNVETYKGKSRSGPRWTHASKGPGGSLRNDAYRSQYLVAYACESGTAAHADAEGAGLSPFTDALVPPLREGEPLQVALNRATTVVSRQTQHRQRPTFRGSLGLDEATGAPLVL